MESIKTYFICNGKKCTECTSRPYCTHTSDPNYALAMITNPKEGGYKMDIGSKSMWQTKLPENASTEAKEFWAIKSAAKKAWEESEIRKGGHIGAGTNDIVVKMGSKEVVKLK